ncbi:STAS-like domain-containing protein [Bdellovibrio bacteriovorus]|uniref:STAS-like domain-containing protein n=1 Tax=Bdellovibrio bacteriovorus TaxID=959 RepID=UPI003AA83EF2
MNNTFLEIDISTYGEHLSDRKHGQQVAEEIIASLKSNSFSGVVIDLRSVRTVTSAFSFELFNTLKSHFGTSYLTNIRLRIDDNSENTGIKHIVIRTLSTIR